jgi:hypothetical protein
VKEQTLTLIQWLTSKCPRSTPASARRTVRDWFAWWYRNDLNRLALLFYTDKGGSLVYATLRSLLPFDEIEAVQYS